jgi:hypothetical protein
MFMSMVSLSVSFSVRALSLALALSLSTAACDSPAHKPTGADAGGNPDGDPDGGAAATGNAATGTGLAVLSSYLDVTSVALYDPSTGAVHDDCVHSGVTGANMEQALSGDATLPSQPQHNGDLAVIDRQNATITYVNPATCAPRLQFSVSTGGLKSNPHDVISVSADKIYVTRYGKNPDPTAATDDFDDGDDIVVVNPRTGVISKAISLSGEIPADAAAGVQARPDRGVLADGKVYVTLNLLDENFSNTASARVVVIDPATDTVVGAIDLPEQKDCSALDYHPAVKKLYVSCVGTFFDPDQVKQSALVEIDLAGPSPTVSRRVPASTVGGQPVNLSYTAVLGDLAFIGTFGSFPDAMTGALGSSDAFFVAALDGSAATKLLDGGAYNLGRAAVDEAHKRVLLPDGDPVTPRVHVFDASGTPVSESGTFEANPAAHLPPREVAWY